MTPSREWEELRGELERVAAAALAYNAYVLDAWDVMWCAAHSFTAVYGEDLAAIVHAAAAKKGVSLTRGGKLDTSVSGPKGHAYLRTYGSCYVVVLRYAGPFDESKARDVATAALPRLEALTLLLPPPGGPGSSGNEAAGTA
jgi:hypothetical protein